MKLITNRISTGKPKDFNDFVADFRRNQIKTASVKTAEQEEADSSGQLDVEPLHQEGESTTMPKAGPSAKKDDGEKSAAATKEPDQEGEDSGQPKAEGSEKLTNNVKFDPNDSSDEEKGITDAGAKAATKVASHCPDCEKSEDKCTCECKSCSAAKAVAVKTAGELPEALKEHQFKAKDGDDDKDADKDADKEAKKDEDKEETKEASHKCEDCEKDPCTCPKEAAAKCEKCECEPCECEKTAATKCKKCECDPCTCKEASKKVEFVKVANLDEKNKGFLREYWRQLFGDDYVSAIIADK